MKKQSGFTLVELVIVILILGILAATALPKFMNVTTDAHRAAVAGVGGAFGSAVSLVHAQWMANGSIGATSDVTNFGNGNVDVNASGWPVAVDDTGTDVNDCVDMWSGVMQNPPPVSATATASDYQATAVGANRCRYIYQNDTSRFVTYDFTNGEVSVTNP